MLSVRQSLTCVTVVIPTYNAEPLIRETLDCVRPQRRRPDEIIAVVGSMGRTRGTVEEWPNVGSGAGN